MPELRKLRSSNTCLMSPQPKELGRAGSGSAWFRLLGSRLICCITATLPWLASLTENEPLASGTAVLYFPGFIIAAISGGRLGMCPDINPNVMSVGTAISWAGIAYLLLRCRSRRHARHLTINQRDAAS